MIRRTGNLYQEVVPSRAIAVLFTSNSIMNTDGSLVMGKGSAQIVKEMYPGVDVELGTWISRKRFSTDAEERPRTFGVAWSKMYPGLGAFQTKRHWRQKSKDCLIRFSVASLLADVHKFHEIHMPYPGIGYGGMTMDMVKPIIMALPDNVYVWTFT